MKRYKKTIDYVANEKGEIKHDVTYWEVNNIKEYNEMIDHTIECGISSSIEEIKEIKEYKQELYNAIIDNDDVKFVDVGMWLVDNWDNDNDELFNNDYPFNYSFDEVIVMDIEELLEVTKLEDIRKWAK